MSMRLSNEENAKAVEEFNFVFEQELSQDKVIPRELTFAEAKEALGASPSRQILFLNEGRRAIMQRVPGGKVTLINDTEAGDVRFYASKSLRFLFAFKEPPQLTSWQVDFCIGQYADLAHRMVNLGTLSATPS